MCILVGGHPELADASLLLEKMRELDRDGMHKSAEYIGNFLLSAHAANSAAHVEALEAFGDVMFNLRQYKRALKYLTDALHAKTGQKSSTGDTELKFRIAKCHYELGEKRLATGVLDSISPRYRTPAINMMLGRLNKSAEIDRAAVSAYKEAFVCDCPPCPRARAVLLDLASISAQ